MNELRVTLLDGERYFQPGEEVHGTATWQFDEAPEGLEVHLFWYTEGKGSQDVGVAGTKVIANPEPRGTKEFRFRVPLGPLSCSGRLISILWAVEVVVVPSFATERAEIVVSCTGREVLLNSPPAPGEHF